MPSSDKAGSDDRESESGLEKGLFDGWREQGEKVSKILRNFCKLTDLSSLPMKKITKPNYNLASPADLRAILSVSRRERSTLLMCRITI